MRAVMSATPPAAKGNTILTALFGYLVCASLTRSGKAKPTVNSRATHNGAKFREVSEPGTEFGKLGSGVWHSWRIVLQDLAALDQPVATFQHRFHEWFCTHRGAPIYCSARRCDSDSVVATP